MMKSLFARKSLAVSAAADAMQDGAVMLDVRTRPEFKSGHIPGAHHISVQSLPQRLPQIARRYENDRVLVICQSGRRSSAAVRLLRAEGVDAINVTGGMAAWKRRGLPVRRG